MDDISLILTLLDKSNYIKYSSYVQEYAVGKETWDVVQAIGKYWASFPSSTIIKPSELRGFFFTICGKMKADKSAVYHAIFSKLEEREGVPLPTTHAALIEHYRKLDYATRIMNVSMRIAANDHSLGDMPAIKELVDEYSSSAVIDSTSLFVKPSLSSTLAAVGAPGLEWRLEELNISAGPLRSGDFIILGARPETGKTTMLAAEATYFASQLKEGDGPVIWVNNEERDNKVMFRVIQAHFGVTTEELVLNKEKYEELYEKAIGNKILVLSDDSGANSTRRLDAVFAEHRPSVIIIDQLDKVYGFNKEARDDLRLGRLYQWARETAKKYGPVIAASQVDGSGEGVDWITMDRLRGSKTDKAGEADCIITIGKKNDPTMLNQRFIHLPKNKMFGGPRTKEEYRHGYFEVTIKPEIARYVGVHKRP